MQNTNLVRLKNLLFNEMIQDGSHNTVCNGFESDFVENLNNLGLFVMATHGTPTIVRVPRADTLSVKNVPTREGTRNKPILFETNRTLGGVDVTCLQGTCTLETTSAGGMSSIGTRTNVGGTPVAHYTKGSLSL